MSKTTKKIFRILNIFLFLFALFLAALLFLPRGWLPEDSWSRNLYRSRLICEEPYGCHYPPNSCIGSSSGPKNQHICKCAPFADREKPIFNLPSQECYNSEGRRGPDYPMIRDSLDVVRIELFGTNVISPIYMTDQDTVRTQLEYILNDAAKSMGLGLRFEVYDYAEPELFLQTMFRHFIYYGVKRRPEIAIFEYRGHQWFSDFDIYGRRMLLKHSKILKLLDKPGIPRVFLGRLFLFMSLAHCILNHCIASSTRLDENLCRLGRLVVKVAKEAHVQLVFFNQLHLDFGRPQPTIFLKCLKDPSVFQLWDSDLQGEDKRKVWLKCEPNANGTFYMAWQMAEKILNGEVNLQLLRK